MEAESVEDASTEKEDIMNNYEFTLGKNIESF